MRETTDMYALLVKAYQCTACRREDEITYKADVKTCEVCHLREGCKPGKNGGSIRHSLYYSYVARLKERQRSFAYKEAMRIRKTTTEPVFADAKNNHGPRHLNVRGLDKPQKAFTLIAVVQNLKKLLRHTMKKRCALAKCIPLGDVLISLSGTMSRTSLTLSYQLIL